MSAHLAPVPCLANVILAVPHATHGWLGHLLDHPGGASTIMHAIRRRAEGVSPLALPELAPYIITAALTPRDLGQLGAEWFVLAEQRETHLHYIRHGGKGERTMTRCATVPTLKAVR